MNSTISLKKLKANAKLEKLIMEGAPYENYKIQFLLFS